MHDLVPAFGEDIYGPHALQYFGSGDSREKKVLKILSSVRGNPDAKVTIFRGVPSGAKAAIHRGDWVTLVREVAADYGAQVLSKEVPARDVTSWADSLLEFGYFPKGENQAIQFMPEPLPNGTVYKSDVGFSVVNRDGGRFRVYTQAGTLVGVVKSLGDAEKLIQRHLK